MNNDIEAGGPAFPVPLTDAQEAAWQDCDRDLARHQWLREIENLQAQAQAEAIEEHEQQAQAEAAAAAAHEQKAQAAAAHEQRVVDAENAFDGGSLADLVGDTEDAKLDAIAKLLIQAMHLEAGLALGALVDARIQEQAARNAQPVRALDALFGGNPLGSFPSVRGAA